MLDRILAFIASFLAKTNTTTTLTPAIGTGSVFVLQFGKVVHVTGQIDTTEALAAGDVLVTGLPRPNINNPRVVATNNNTSAEPIHYFYVNTQNNIGQLRCAGTAAAASRSFRFAFSYIKL